MCVFRQKIPKLPEPRPIAPAPEKTASALTTGKNRKSRSKKSSFSSGGGGKNTGTDSLRIPLTKKGNLRY